MSSLTLEKLLNDPSAKILLTDTSKGYISELRDLGTDTIVGGFYEFYPNGKLKNYEFFYDRKEDSSAAFIKQYGDSIISFSAYGEYFDSTGKLERVQYNPFVYSLIRIKKDCIVNFKLYFFALDKEYDFINIRTSNDKQFKLKPQPDTLYTNMKFVSFETEAKGLDSLFAYVSADYKNLNWGTHQTLSDTVLVKVCANKRGR
ncbi:MAG TPA: hypothetical protein VL092_05670 [Chitinophagaceae bacterium]|nr:hypothetical protein [Chitinophagaceae bacterium]